MNDFDYLGAGEVYLDAACQSLRPRQVIDAVNNYYTEHNSCGERVKYKWGVETDEKVEATRAEVLKFLKLPKRKYTVSFTLNTTYGINLILSQLKADAFDKIMTSEIEHNSPFLASMAFSERTGLPREVMARNEDGSIDVKEYDFTKAVVVINCASNFDGRKLLNIKEIVKGESMLLYWLWFEHLFLLPLQAIKSLLFFHSKCIRYLNLHFFFINNITIILNR